MAPRTSTSRSARLDASPSAYLMEPPETSSTSPRPMPATSLLDDPRTTPSALDPELVLHMESANASIVMLLTLMGH
eukprot:7580163-Heterocapsa_arctica.AAC.1